jgi:ubiquinone/menaquinone biosynthesis C-methylase UbiE
MSDTEIRFDDGAAYEQMMGLWSRLAGDVFLDWLAPPPGRKWIDVGCGNGASTAMIVERCAPSGVVGIDPSEGQLAYARSRLAGSVAEFRQGGGGSLPFADASFDIGMMALVIFFLPEPAKGVAELARVVRPGGLVATYAWDMLGGGFTLEPIFAELRQLDISPTLPPSSEAARMDALRELWTKAGLTDIETREIVVRRSFTDFEEYWTTSLMGPGRAFKLNEMPPEALEQFKRKVKARLEADASGRVTATARANAIKGRKPA